MSNAIEHEESLLLGRSAEHDLVRAIAIEIDGRDGHSGPTSIEWRECVEQTARGSEILDRGILASTRDHDHRPKLE